MPGTTTSRKFGGKKSNVIARGLESLSSSERVEPEVPCFRKPPPLEPVTKNPNFDEFFPSSEETLRTSCYVGGVQDEESRLVQLFVKTMQEMTVAVRVLPEDTIGELKLKLQQQAGISAKMQRLEYGGKPLNDSLCIRDYNIRENATLMGFLSWTGTSIGR